MKAKKKKVVKKKLAKIPFYEASIDQDLKAVKKAGLNKIDDVLYTLVKTGAKNSSPYGYADKFVVTKNAIAKMVTFQGHAWIVAFGMGDYFKTSPVLKTTKKGKNYLLETENSFYTLERQ